MIPFVILRKILLFFAPIVIFYILRKIGGKHPKNRSHLSEFDPSTPSTKLRTSPLRASKEKIVEGEIVDESTL